MEYLSNFEKKSDMLTNAFNGIDSLSPNPLILY